MKRVQFQWLHIGQSVSNRKRNLWNCVSWFTRLRSLYLDWDHWLLGAMSETSALFYHLLGIYWGHCLEPHLLVMWGKLIDSWTFSLNLTLKLDMSCNGLSQYWITYIRTVENRQTIKHLIEVSDGLKRQFLSLASDVRGLLISFKHFTLQYLEIQQQLSMVYRSAVHLQMNLGWLKIMIDSALRGVVAQDRCCLIFFGIFGSFEIKFGIAVSY